MKPSDRPDSGRKSPFPSEGEGSPSISVESRLPNLRLIKSEPMREILDTLIDDMVPVTEEFEAFEAEDDEVTEIYVPGKNSKLDQVLEQPKGVSGVVQSPASAPGSKPASEGRATRVYQEISWEYEFQDPTRASEPAPVFVESKEHLVLDDRTGNIDMQSLLSDQATSSFTEDQLFLSGSPASESAPFGDPFSVPRAKAPTPKQAQNISRKKKVMFASGLVVVLAAVLVIHSGKEPRTNSKSSPESAVAGLEREGELGSELVPQMSAEAEQPIPPTAEELDRATPATAAQSFSVGDYPTALRYYRILETRYPEEPAYPVIVRALDRWAKQEGARK